MGRHPAADAALFLCVFGRWVGCAYLGDGSRCPALRGASSALPEESRSGRSGAETGRVVVQARGSWQRYGARGGGGQQDDARRGWRRGGEGTEVGGGVMRDEKRARNGLGWQLAVGRKLAEVWSEGWWRVAGRCAEGVASRRRGGGSWRRGVAGEHAARGHCLTGIEPLRGSTTSFSVTSGARSPAAFRPRWPLSAPLIASAPVPAPALVPRPSAPAGLSPLL